MRVTDEQIDASAKQPIELLNQQLAAGELTPEEYDEEIRVMREETRAFLKAVFGIE